MYSYQMNIFMSSRYKQAALYELQTMHPASLVTLSWIIMLFLLWTLKYDSHIL